MIMEVRLCDEDIERLAARIVELISRPPSDETWLNVAAAAAHLGLTEDAIRGLVKRGQIPVYRMENGRLRFPQGDACSSGATCGNWDGAVLSLQRVDRRGREVGA
jgi:hypothetical protein